MVELFQVTNLSKSPLCVGRVLEGIKYFFEGDCLVGLFVAGFPDVTVRTGTNLANYFKSLFDLRLYFFTHPGGLIKFILLLSGIDDCLINIYY